MSSGDGKHFAWVPGKRIPAKPPLVTWSYCVSTMCQVLWTQPSYTVTVLNHGVVGVKGVQRLDICFVLFCSSNGKIEKHHKTRVVS